MDHTFSYRIKNPSVHAHFTLFRHRNFKHFETSVACARNWTCVTSSHTDIKMAAARLGHFDQWVKPRIIPPEVCLGYQWM